MPNSLITTSEKPREALTKYVDQLHSLYECWYEASRQRVGITWQLLQLLSYLAGFGAALFGALGHSDNPFHKFWMIVLPLVGSFAASMIVQFRLYELTQAREQGRVAFQALAEEGRRRLAAAATDAELTKIHEELAAKANEIEVSQTQSFFGLFKPK